MIDVLVGIGFSIQRRTRVLDVSSQHYCAYRRRTMLPTIMRCEWLKALIKEAYVASLSTYGARRVRAEQTKGRGIHVNVNLVTAFPHNAGMAGPPRLAKVKRIKRVSNGDELVEREFPRNDLDESPNIYLAAQLRTRHSRRNCLFARCGPAIPARSVLEKPSLSQRQIRAWHTQLPTVCSTNPSSLATPTIVRC